LTAAQGPDDYADKADRLAWVQELEKAGHVDVFYGDESGFCLTSAIPYGWQFAGEHVATQPRHSQRFNVLGFYNAATNELHAAAREASLDAAFVLDAWAATRTRPTILVLANARIHHAASFQARLDDWEAQNVHIFYLPTYCPHLHKIETLWRKIKYEWLRPEAYATFQTLKTAVWHILDRVGQQYTIRFTA
jgi:transposase